MTHADAVIRTGAPVPSLAIDVAVEDRRWRGIVGDRDIAVSDAARAAATHAGLAGGAAELCVVLGDDALVRGLNHDFRDQDRPTNVLSFALNDGDRPGSAFGSAPVMLGDVVLAFETVTREAREQSKSPRDHTLHLVVHGVLHLMGYDHGTAAEARTMERMEQRVLADLGIADPYFERPPPA